MAIGEENKKKQNDNSITGNDNNNSTMSGEEYQKMLGSESYKSLLQADLQAENSKNIALRNTNMALQNAGLTGNAYGGTLANSTANAYLTALQQNMSDFNANIGNEGLSNMSLIEQNLAQAQNKDEYLSYLKDMEIGVNENGLDFTDYKGYLSDTQKNLLNSEYLRQMKNFDTQTTATDENTLSINDTNSKLNYNVKLVNGKTGLNTDIDINFGDYIVQGEFGAKISVYSNFSKDINSYPKNATTGQITFAQSNDGKEGAFLIYDGKNWRVLEMRYGGRTTKEQQFMELAKKYGVDISKYESVIGISETGGKTKTSKLK